MAYPSFNAACVHFIRLTRVMDSTKRGKVALCGLVFFNLTVKDYDYDYVYV